MKRIMTINKKIREKNFQDSDNNKIIHETLFNLQLFLRIQMLINSIKTIHNYWKVNKH